jgi:hypothetical protein
MRVLTHFTRTRQNDAHSPASKLTRRRRWKQLGLDLYCSICQYYRSIMKRERDLQSSSITITIGLPPFCCITSAILLSSSGSSFTLLRALIFSFTAFNFFLSFSKSSSNSLSIYQSVKSDQFRNLVQYLPSHTHTSIILLFIPSTCFRSTLIVFPVLSLH